MSKIWKYSRKIIIGLTGVVFLIITYLLIAIPVAKMAEGKVLNPGKMMSKYVLTGCNVVDIQSNEILTSRSVFINQGIIEKIMLDSLSDYSGYQKIENKNNYVVPGLIDMHSHIFDRTDLTQYLSYGVTTVRNMMGFPMHLRWKAQLKSGDFPGSRIITAGPTLNNEGQGGPFHKGLSSANGAIKAVEDIKKQGYDFVKVYDGITSEQMKAIMETANRLNIQVAGHPPRSLTIEELSVSGMQSIEHVEELFQGLLDYEFDETGARKIAKTFADNEVEVCVTLSAYHQIYMAVVNKQPFVDQALLNPINTFIKFIGKKQMAEYPTYSKKGYDWTVKKYAFMEKIVQILDEEGVTLLFGTDTGPSLTVPGQTVLDELRLLQNTGLSNYQIIRSATIDAAENLGLSKEIGSLEVGKRADFIVTSNNPLEDISAFSRPNAIANGDFYFDDEAIQALRGLGETKQGWYVTIGNFLEYVIGK